MAGWPAFRMLQIIAKRRWVLLLVLRCVLSAAWVRQRFITQIWLRYVGRVGVFLVISVQNPSAHPVCIWEPGRVYYRGGEAKRAELFIYVDESTLLFPYEDSIAIPPNGFQEIRVLVD